MNGILEGAKPSLATGDLAQEFRKAFPSTGN